MPFHYIELSPSTALTNSSTPQAKSSFLLGKTGGASWCHRSSNLCHIPFFFASGPSNNWHSTFNLVQKIFTSWLYCISKRLSDSRRRGSDAKMIDRKLERQKKCRSHANIATPTLHFRVANMDGAHFSWFLWEKKGLNMWKWSKRHRICQHKL